MNIEQNLTKENFFNEMKEKYPNSMKHFCDWIDEYKKEVGWIDLFGNIIKYHSLPYAMQYGIWIEYCRESLSNFFEQPEHISDTVDLREDIQEVFKETEALHVFDGE